MLRLIYGPSIKRLSSKVLEDVGDLSRLWPETRAFIIVPENRKVSTERRYLEGSGQTGLMMAEVLSFSRLAFRIFDMAGLSQAERLTREGQAMLVSVLIDRHRGDMRLLHRLAAGSGYVTKIVDSLGYLRRYSVEPEQLEAAAAATRDRQLSAKFGDFAILLRAYNEALSDIGKNDPERGLEELAVLLETMADGMLRPVLEERLSILRRTWFWVTGFGEFRDFAPKEYRILSALARISGELTVTVSTDVLVKSQDELDRVAPAFMLGSRSAFGLMSRIRFDEKIFLPGEDLIHQDFRQVLAGNDASDPQALGNYLSVLAAETIQDEVTVLGGLIRRLTLDGEVRYRDIAVVTADSASYNPLIRTIFPSFGIPAFIDERRSLADTPLLRFVLALIDTQLSGWQSEHVMALLRSGVLQISHDETDSLENYWLQHGVFRNRIFSWQGYPNELRELVDGKLEPLRAALRNLAEQTACRSLIAALNDIFRMDIVDLGGWVQSEIEWLSRGSDADYAVSLAKAWNSLGEIESDLLELFDDNPLDLRTLRQILQVAAESNFAGIIPTNVDQVTVVTPSQALGSDVDYVFLLGAKNGLLPASVPDTYILKDQDFQVLAESQDLDIPGNSAYQTEGDAFIFLQLLGLAHKRLHVSLTGKPDELAPGLLMIKRYLDLTVKTVAPGIHRPDDIRLMSPLELERRLILAHADEDEIRSVLLPEHENDPDSADYAWQALADCLESREEGVGDKRRQLIESALDRSSTDLLLPSMLTRELLAYAPVISVSQLETYAACPYDYFAAYLLQASEREVYEPDSLSRGTLLHRIFEIAFSELHTKLSAAADSHEREAVWEEFRNRNPKTESQRLYTAAVKSHPQFQIFEEDANLYSAGRPVRKVIETAWPAMLSLLKESGYVPHSFELSFGRRLIVPQLQFKVDDQLTLSLRGIVDRVDIRPTEGQPGNFDFQIADYKSSRKAIDLNAILEGLDLQLLTYLEAVQALGLPGIPPDKLTPRDAMFLRLDEAHIAVDSRPDNYEQALAEVLKKYFAPQQLNMEPDDLKLLMQLNHENWNGIVGDIVSGRFDVRPRMAGSRNLPCDYCANRSACLLENEASHAVRLAGISALPDYASARKDKDRLIQYLRDKYGRTDT